MFCTANQLLKTLDKTYQRGDNLRSESAKLLQKIQGEPTRSGGDFKASFFFKCLPPSCSPVALFHLDPHRVLGRVEAIQPNRWEHTGGHQDDKRSPIDDGEDAKTKLYGSERTG